MKRIKNSQGIFNFLQFSMLDRVIFTHHRHQVERRQDAVDLFIKFIVEIVPEFTFPVKDHGRLPYPLSRHPTPAAYRSGGARFLQMS